LATVLQQHSIASVARISNCFDNNERKKETETRFEKQHVLQDKESTRKRKEGEKELLQITSRRDTTARMLGAVVLS
jgi:hypothetical protein